MLIARSVNHKEDFNWYSQLRFYHDTNRKSVKVKMLTSSVDYQDEYLGVTNRLVITPLTDRAFCTLMTAISHNLGGAPEGPAGTGKSETIKDLAR
jgi:dynein heavy chain, axonemal